MIKDTIEVALHEVASHYYQYTNQDLKLLAQQVAEQVESELATAITAAVHGAGE